MHATPAPTYTTIQWKRFWCRLGSTIHCDSGGGFLTDPDDNFGRHANPDVKPLGEILPESGPLLLCGEPGIGKSTELDGIRVTLDGEQGSQTVWIVFRDVADFADFRRLTVESASWRQWREGDGQLTLVVDGVDEGLLRVPNFVNDLTALLRDQPLARLRLVLACRTAEWPVEMGRRLFALWPEPSKTVSYELCPLRRTDAALAAATRGLDAEAFLEAVWQRSVTGLASRPVTLFFLLREFRGGTLPATYRELYERGTENLAREINPARLEILRALRKTEHRCSDADRLQAAERLAVLLLVTGRSAIWQDGGAFEERPPQDLSLDSAGDTHGHVTREAAQEALESALFTSLGERRFGFAHQTFAECLAARHLAKLPLVQLRRLLCQRDSRGEHVIPQLAELAAWTAGYHAGFSEHLLRIEPEMLLRSDVTRLQGALKSRLVAALLEGAEREEIFDGMNFGRFMPGLKHPGLAAQLTPYITDKGTHYIARRMAFSMAARCELHELTDVVLAVVCDVSDDAHMRDCAADTLEDIVPDERLELLEPLARGETGSDANDSIKGHALRRLMPSRWKVRDALPFLTPRRNDRYMGVYQMLLRSTLPKLLEDADVAPCLAAVRAKPGCLDSLHSLHPLAAAAFAKALDLLAVPEIASEVGHTLQVWATRHELHRLERDSQIVAALKETAVRRKLAALYLNDARTQLGGIYHLCHPLAILDGKHDLPWLLDELPKVQPDRRRVWAGAVGCLASPEATAACWDHLLQRITEIRELAEQFAWLRAWELDEKMAREAKARWLRDQRRRAEHERWQREHTPPDPRKGLDAAFAAYEGGNKEAWFWLWWHLTHDQDGTEAHLLECDMEICPNWSLLTDEEKVRVGGIARVFLLALAPRAEEFEKLSEVGLAAGAAVWLLRETIEQDTELLATIRQAWIPPMVWHVDTQSEPRRALFELAYRLAPAETIAEFKREVASELKQHGRPFAFRAAKNCWDARLSQACIELLSQTVDSKSLLGGLEELAARDLDRAVEFSAGLLESVHPGAPAYPISTFAAVVTALTWGSEKHWSSIQALLEADDDLARAVFEKVCYGIDTERKDMLKQLDEPALADFCLLLHKVFPAPNDPPQPRSGFVSGSDAARQTRRSIPGILAARATEAACRELLRMAAVLPVEATSLRWIYREAVTNVRRGMWLPPEPETVKDLIARPNSRLLKTEDDLLDLILESLERLQARLTARTLPAVEDLWRWKGGGNARSDFQPKDEEALSDYIARWLADDIGPLAGVVVGREVQPRRGLRTDIIVDAMLPGSNGGFDKFTVVIEVKGCWHPEVKTALQTQLAEDYLRPHGLRCGIYLVGWFVCARWKNAVNRLGSTDKASAREEIAALPEEYREGKCDLRIETVLLDCTF